MRKLFIQCQKISTLQSSPKKFNIQLKYFLDLFWMATVTAQPRAIDSELSQIIYNFHHRIIFINQSPVDVLFLCKLFWMNI